MGRMDATLFVHPAQLMAVIQKKDQIDCKFFREKRLKILKNGLNMCHIFGG